MGSEVSSEAIDFRAASELFVTVRQQLTLPKRRSVE